MSGWNKGCALIYRYLPQHRLRVRAHLKDPLESLELPSLTALTYFKMTQIHATNVTNSCSLHSSATSPRWLIEC